MILWSGRCFNVDLWPMFFLFTAFGGQSAGRFCRWWHSSENESSIKVIGNSSDWAPFFSKSLCWRKEVHSAFWPSFACKEGFGPRTHAHISFPLPTGPHTLIRLDFMACQVLTREEKMMPTLKTCQIFWATSRELIMMTDFFFFFSSAPSIKYKCQMSDTEETDAGKALRILKSGMLEFPSTRVTHHKDFTHYGL